MTISCICVAVFFRQFASVIPISVKRMCWEKAGTRSGLETLELGNGRYKYTEPTIHWKVAAMAPTARFVPFHPRGPNVHSLPAPLQAWGSTYCTSIFEKTNGAAREFGRDTENLF